MTEPGEMDQPLLQAGGAPPPPPAAPPTPPPEPAAHEAPTQPTAAPRQQLFGAGAQSAPPYPSAPRAPLPPLPSYGYAPVPPAPPAPAPSRWRRALAVVAVIAMVLVGGALLGNATRGGGLFSSDSNTAAQNDTSGSSSSDASSINRPSDSANVSGVTGKVQPGLVNITTTLYGGGGQGAGSGMVISSSGEVLTNNHVIENAASISVEIGGDGESHSAKVIGYDVADDVALIKIEGVSDLETIPIGDPNDVVVDDPIVVLGNALGRGGDPTPAPGTVTALNRQITATDADGTNAETLSNLIQVQADVQPGDSGGALVDSDGEVIGMTTAASSNNFRFQEESAGVGFAIRIDKAMSIVKLIRNGEEVDGVHVGSRGMLGVSLPSELSLAPGGRNTPSTGDGAEVIGVTEDGPAADAGIETGDIIISIGDATISSGSDLSTEMDRYHAGDKVEVGWIDASGNTQRATVKLMEGPPA